LREAQAEAEPTSRWRASRGGNWLLKLDDAGEMLPLPEFSGVPLTKSWYLGLANIRGCSRASWISPPSWEESTRAYADCRLLLIAERFHSFSGLLISACSAEERAGHAAGEKATEKSWVGAAYRDEDGRLWLELDMSVLVTHDDFLQVAPSPR